MLVRLVAMGAVLQRLRRGGHPFHLGHEPKLQRPQRFYRTGLPLDLHHRFGPPPTLLGRCRPQRVDLRDHLSSCGPASSARSDTATAPFSMLQAIATIAAYQQLYPDGQLKPCE